MYKFRKPGKAISYVLHKSFEDLKKNQKNKEKIQKYQEIQNLWHAIETKKFFYFVIFKNSFDNY